MKKLHVIQKLVSAFNTFGSKQANANLDELTEIMPFIFQGMARSTQLLLWNKIKKPVAYIYITIAVVYRAIVGEIYSQSIGY